MVYFWHGFCFTAKGRRDRVKNMKPDDDKRIDREFTGKKFDLPFCNRAIRLNETGAKVVAFLACRMAMNHAFPIQSYRKYAEQMADFSETIEEEVNEKYLHGKDDAFK